MARAVRNTPHLARALRAVTSRPAGSRPNLLAFFLFDERISHQVVQEFARQQFGWLNGLAATNRMILYFFLPESEPAAHTEAEEAIFVADGADTVANPSLEVARQFGLGPPELPGVVFFTELDVTRPGRHEGVFWPLGTEIFEGPTREAENAFSHLFGLVQEAREEAGDPTLLLATLRGKIETEQASERAQPIVTDMQDKALKPVTFDRALIDATTFAFAGGRGL